MNILILALINKANEILDTKLDYINDAIQTPFRLWNGMEHFQHMYALYTFSDKIIRISYLLTEDVQSNIHRPQEKLKATEPPSFCGLP